MLLYFLFPNQGEKRNFQTARLVMMTRDCLIVLDLLFESQFGVSVEFVCPPSACVWSVCVLQFSFIVQDYSHKSVQNVLVKWNSSKLWRPLAAQIFDWRFLESFAFTTFHNAVLYLEMIRRNPHSFTNGFVVYSNLVSIIDSLTVVSKNRLDLLLLCGLEESSIFESRHVCKREFFICHTHECLRMHVKIVLLKKLVFFVKILSLLRTDIFDLSVEKAEHAHGNIKTQVSKEIKS